MKPVDLERLKDQKKASLNVFQASLSNLGAALVHVDQSVAELINATLQYANAFFHMDRLEGKHPPNSRSPEIVSSDQKLSLDLHRRRAFYAMASIVKVLLMTTLKGQPNHMLTSLLDSSSSNANGGGGSSSSSSSSNSSSSSSSSSSSNANGHKHPNGTESPRFELTDPSDQHLLANSRLFAHQYEKGASIPLQQEDSILTIVARMHGSPDLEISGRS